ncbi:ABC transporter substrate-binding protein [Hahella sp. HN01]|uniref:substrate-binding periplasmic protein n=1 Tax=Hahella sp. HN01 TaxID=2847262 RepID=UPI001C1EE39D|nr:transporter substrate-binding domain-containing protein [Hahella sp. HN01]MBU6954228.1 transporter substrate-binding domain-containing protein [Hahella sp. HN01]
MSIVLLRRLASWLLVSAGLWTTAASADSSINLACNYFPPQKIDSPENTDRPGYDIELLQAAFQQVGVAVTFRYFPWNRALELARTGTYDGLCSCSYLPERESFLYFSDELGALEKGFFTLSGRKIHKVGALSDMKPYKLAVVRGYNLETELEKAGLENIETVGTDKLLLNMLTFQRVDAIYSFADTIQYEAQQMGNPPELNFIGITSAPYYTCFSKRHPMSLDTMLKFNKGLRMIRESGEYDRIRQKYLGVPKSS